ncbi:MAG: hypothetical protein DMF92_15175 [Acidobacteria bacterium]|nr:MAG: hypothetical protein DMF92_15175 [Acidobacteriota bacterium]
MLLRVGSLALVALAFPFYSALAGRSLNPTLLMMLAGLCASLVNGAFAVVLTDLFPTRVRFSGVALGFNVAFTIFSGTAPLVATSLIRSTGLSTAPAFVMVACGLFTFVGSLGLSRDGGYVLERERGGERSGHSGQDERSRPAAPAETPLLAPPLESVTTSSTQVEF